MTPEERYTTVRNVISDLHAYLDQAEKETGDYAMPAHLWQDAKLAAEYITTDTPHL